MCWQQLSQKAASSETKHLPGTPGLINVFCHPWAGPNTRRMNVSIPWHQTKAASWHVWKLLTSTQTERSVFRWRNASQESHTSVAMGSGKLGVLLSAQQLQLQGALSLHFPHGRGKLDRGADEGGSRPCLILEPFPPEHQRTSSEYLVPGLTVPHAGKAPPDQASGSHWLVQSHCNDF